MDNKQANTIRVIGSYLSPYVRKVLVCLAQKGLSYDIDPIVPFYGNEEFERLSPLRRIPVLIDGANTIADSTVICEYLEDAYPENPLLPATAASRSRARWLEEFADSRLGEVFIWHLYNQRVIRRFVWGLPPEDEVLSRAINEEIPHVMCYLESQLPGEGFLFGALSIADIAIASFFRNAAFAGYEFDQGRWPNTTRFVNTALDIPAFKALAVFEAICLKVPIKNHRQALLDAGAPIAKDSVGTEEARPGVLSL